MESILETCELGGEEARASARAPGLTAPFAIVGAAAGWMTSGVVDDPFYFGDRPPKQIIAAAVACGFGALVGAIASRFVRARRPFEDERRIWASVAPLLVLAGAATGALTEIATGGRLAAMSAAMGAAGAMCFAPICAFVVAAARRAERARLGSIVASADARSVWAVLFAVMAPSTLAAVTAWDHPAFFVMSFKLRWLVPVAIAVVALAVVALTTMLDVLAALRVRRLARDATLTELSTDRGAVVEMDLGLGEGLAGRVASGAAAYRSLGRASSLVAGSFDEARRALGAAVRRDALATSACAVVLVIHVFASTDAGRRLADSGRCAAGLEWSCRAADLSASDRTRLFGSP